MTARRRWATPVVPLYAAVVAAKAALRRAGWLKTRRLKWPVVSVGSISAGGAGKTPVVMALATLLHGRGWDVDVLSRGYGRTGSGVERVEPQAKDAAARFGDEPVLLARATGAAVWVGGDREAAGRAAEKAHHALAAQDGLSELMGSRRVHLLDDGMQHRGLARDFEVALLTAEDLEDTLLPAGNLREPPSALRRADAVVVREDELDAVKESAWRWMREGAQLWVVQRRLVFPAPLFVFTAGLRPVAFCAIARPEDFQTMLLESGCGVVETVAFADHHAYELRDIDRVVEVARAINATGFVTTEKDGVKLTVAMRARLEEVGPLMEVRLEAEFTNGDSVLDALEAHLGAPR